jgi:hypothetical protein
MPNPEPNANKPEATKAATRKGRWLRFSLRSLLILMLLFAIPCGWVAKRMREKRLEHEAIAEMAEHGGHLLEYYVGSPPTKSSFIVWLEGWLGEGFFTTMTKLSLDGPMTDGGFEQVANCRSLKEIWVNNAELTANGLLPLKDLHELELIDLDNCSKTATDLEFLDGMPRLNYLGLAWFYPTEAGWERIKSLSEY